MKVKLLENSCVVTKEAADKKYYGSNWSDVESTFLHHVKQELIKQGFDVIKKRMWKDGHMVDDTQQYIRTRKPGSDPTPDWFCIYNSSYAVFDAGDSFNDLEIGENLYLMVIR